jgi:hypothetical protein
MNSRTAAGMSRNAERPIQKIPSNRTWPAIRPEDGIIGTAPNTLPQDEQKF